ncbi:SH3 domain-containing kinase-binding protein 1-like isoform X2 [Columba livia]|uniref:SH3 domain-containing kinase-binding protein 1-like isoform X2 n=1 Tax=Columba livia TaxID=8932 RepID=UPI0031BB179D
MARAVLAVVGSRWQFQPWGQGGLSWEQCDPPQAQGGPWAHTCGLMAHMFLYWEVHTRVALGLGGRGMLLWRDSILPVPRCCRAGGGLQPPAPLCTEEAPTATGMGAGWVRGWVQAGCGAGRRGSCPQTSRHWDMSRRKHFLPWPCRAVLAAPVPALVLPPLPELLAPVRMEPTRLPPSKRMAPAPPVPAKAKPAPVLASKPSDPQPCALADMERGRSGDPDADGFNVAPVTTAKLSHPTAARPRVPGQRPPSLALGSTGRPCWGDEPHAGLGVPLPSAAPGPPWGAEVPVAPRPEEKLALEDLKAEVRTLHILVDLMRVQHLRDLEDMRLELGQERAKRQALQAEIEQVRKVLPW